MNTTPQLDQYWLEVSDMTIFDAAFWMQIGSDPQVHQDRCAQDSAYDIRFHDAGGAEAVHGRALAILSAIRVGDIKVTKEKRRSDGSPDDYRTLILKLDWINWCRRNGHAELADRFERTTGSGIDVSEVATSLAENQIEGGDSRKGGAHGTVSSGPVSNTDIPGKIPRTGAGKLAVEAAWQIESATKSAPTALEVMTQLRAWAEAGSKADVLCELDKEKRGVEWATIAGKKKAFDIEACGKALATWRRSRA